MAADKHDGASSPLDYLALNGDVQNVTSKNQACYKTQTLFIHILESWLSIIASISHARRGTSNTHNKNLVQKAVSRRALNRQANSRGTKPIRTKYTATHLQTSIFSSGNCKKKTKERRCSHLCNLRYLFYCFAATKTAHDNNKRTSSSSSSSAAAATPACCRLILPHENLSVFLVVF